MLNRLSIFVDGDRGDAAQIRMGTSPLRPSTFVDGDPDAADIAGRSLTGFNTAVDLRGRTPLSIASAAVSARLRMGPSIFRRRRPYWQAADASGAVVQASMGPSIFVDGDLPRSTAARRPGPCFNGAVDLRRWRLYIPLSRGARTAASMGPSIFVVDGDIVSHSNQHCSPASMGPSTRVDGDPGSRCAKCSKFRLQWGRRRESTETHVVQGSCTRAARASMGPSRCRRRRRARRR